jgi:ADP-heptose:LPS heptosyltransferase
MYFPPDPDALLVHLASGIGNIVLATPLLALLARRGFTVDARVDGDYPETADLLRDWSALRQVSVGTSAPPTDYRAVLPAIPPFYWRRYAALYSRLPNAVPRPPDAAFYHDEQSWYLAFATHFGGPATPAETPHCTLPVAPDPALGVSAATLVLAPGCKGGEMAAKRWPHFAALATQFAEVAVVGTADDLAGFAGAPRPPFPPHARILIGRLTLRQTAAVLAAAGAVVANDSGLGHIAAALGVPTVLLFGPTPAAALGRFPPNVTVLRPDLGCAPCWFGARFAACARRIDCLDRLTPSRVAAAVNAAGLAS